MVAEGALEPAGTFKADSVLAKHDETYMPKEVADALKKQGHWKDDGGRRQDAATGKPQRERNAMIAETRPLRAGAGARRWRWCRRCVPLYRRARATIRC